MTKNAALEGEIVINGIKYVPSDSIIGSASAPKVKGLKLVLIRSYASGVHYGYIKNREDLQSGLKATLLNSRRIWYWDGACSLSQLALDGVNPAKVSNCKFSVVVPEIEVTQVIEIIPVSAKAVESINAVPVWKQ